MTIDEKSLLDRMGQTLFEFRRFGVDPDDYANFSFFMSTDDFCEFLAAPQSSYVSRNSTGDYSFCEYPVVEVPDLDTPEFIFGGTAWK